MEMPEPISGTSERKRKRSFTSVDIIIPSPVASIPKLQIQNLFTALLRRGRIMLAESSDPKAIKDSAAP